MTTYIGLSLTELENKLFNKERSFNKFQSITDSDIEIIKESISKTSNNKEYHGLELYKKSLEFLTNPNIHRLLPTYDHKLIYLILTTDPNLEALKEFYQTNYPTVDENDEEEKEKLNRIEERKKINYAMANKIRNKIGFYNRYLILYEQYYFYRFTKNTTLLDTGNIEYVKRLLKNVTNDLSFSNVNDIAIERIKRIVEKYETNCQNISIEKTAFHTLTQNSILNLHNYLEQLIFFIMVTDPELQILKIYEEESKLTELKRRSIELFGLFDINFIKAEKAYHQRICPDKKISIWTI